MSYIFSSNTVGFFATLANITLLQTWPLSEWIYNTLYLPQSFEENGISPSISVASNGRSSEWRNFTSALPINSSWNQKSSGSQAIVQYFDTWGGGRGRGGGGGGGREGEREGEGKEEGMGEREGWGCRRLPPERFIRWPRRESTILLSCFSSDQPWVQKFMLDGAICYSILLS